MFRRKQPQPPVIEARREPPSPNTGVEPSILRPPFKEAPPSPHGAAPTGTERKHPQLVLTPEKLTFFVRLSNVPSETEFSRLCSALSERGVHGIFLPSLPEISGKARENLLRQLSFLVRTFGLEPIWPMSGEEDLSVVARSCLLLELSSEFATKGEMVSKVHQKGVGVLLRFGGTTAPSDLLEALEHHPGGAVSLPARRTQESEQFDLASLVSLRRLTGRPIVIDCSSVPYSRIDEFALPGVTAGGCGVVVGVHCGVTFYGQERHGLTLDEFVGLRGRLQALKTTVNILSKQEQGYDQ